MFFKLALSQRRGLLGRAEPSQTDGVPSDRVGSAPWRPAGQATVR